MVRRQYVANEQQITLLEQKGIGACSQKLLINDLGFDLGHHSEAVSRFVVTLWSIKLKLIILHVYTNRFMMV